MNTPPPPDPGEPRSVLDWAREAGAARRLEIDLAHALARRRRRRWQLGAVASVALLAIGAGWLIRPNVSPGKQSETLAADGVRIAAPPQRRLDDGSVIELNGAPRLDVDFSGPQRRVRLDAGEAHFAVAKNPARPFVVTVGDLEVRAVGTAFAIARRDGEIAVVVTEGRVAVSSPNGATAPVQLAAGEGLRVADTAAAIPAADLAARLAWRVPRIELAGTPLARVAELFNAHAAAHGGPRLVLADPALAPLRVSGVLRADDTESLLRVLAGAFGIVAEPRGGEVVLRRP